MASGAVDGGTQSSGPRFDRRQAVKRAAVAGAVAWSAPVVLSSRAQAMDGTCTPKCLPVAGPSTAPGISRDCLGNGSNRVVRIVLTGVNPVPVNCPCGGDAVLGQLQVTSSAGAAAVNGTTVTIFILTGFPSTFEVTATQTASCNDRADDPCESTCTTVYRVSVGFSNNGNCNGFSQSVAVLRSSCS